MGSRIFGALRDDPSITLMDGDLTEVEICDVCGNEVECYSIIDGLIICESCKENFEIQENEDFSSNVCAICGWPINRVLSKNDTRMLVKGVERWLRINDGLSDRLKKKLDRLAGRELYLCRYDFFFLIKDIIESENLELAKKFEEEIASKYDFYGGIIS